ncbi:hypothetical protein [Flavobacterium sp. SM2513]|uniref:hypothetical protein n=1 Tax=Flavobacterium sp. SM2513 TaxID=3424766 RepID=UPI003D7F575E
MKIKESFYLLCSSKVVLLFMLLVFTNILGYSNSNLSSGSKLSSRNGVANLNFTESHSSEQDFELHRFWLNLKYGSTAVGQTLIGYVTGATQGVDSGIDALYFNDSALALTSLINNNEYIIQGRSVPFLNTDVVRLGFKTDVAGSFTIALANFDGLFLSSQAIFLKDKVTGTLQNLKVSHYTFTSQIGVFNERFEIHFKNDITTYENGSWDNGIPTIEMHAVILDDFITSTDLVTNSLTIKPGTFFTVASGTTLTVENAINNEAGVDYFVIENNGTLLQNSSIPSTALATVKRNSYDLFRQDYTLWSSPVFEPNLRNFSPATLFNRFSTYDFDTSVNGSYKQEIFTNADVLHKKFLLAKGYLIRMPNNSTPYAVDATPQFYPGVFKGILNNGAITIPLYGIVPSVSNGLNLVGNPYPSAISIPSFFAANPTLATTLYFWRKQASTDPLYTGVSGYATYTSMGFVSADVNINTITPTDIQTGQGFFVVANSAVPGDLIFNNEMRTNGAATFFKSSTETAEMHRLWLNLSHVTEIVGQTLIGYKIGATEDADNGIDALYFNDGVIALTSLIGNKEYIIQGRSLPFVDTDVVPLGFKTNVTGSYTISLADFDGLFAENQNIFLKDNLTAVLHNLKLSAYTFTTQLGLFNERFEVHYSSTLGTTDSEFVKNSILIAVHNQNITINAGSVIMDKIELIDAAGRVIYTEEGVNDSKITLQNILATNQFLLVRIYTKDHTIVHQKILF